MAAGPFVLGFDTSAAHCAAAVLDGERCLATRVEEMGRGQAERLMPLLEELLAEAGLNWRDLHRIGVGVGPGNFTGIRISVAAARGLALGLGIPAIGVSTFDAIQLADPEAAAAVPAPRGQIYLQLPGGAPALVTDSTDITPVLPPDPAELACRIARIAALSSSLGRPAPLYIKPADAAPARDAAPLILS